MSDERLDDTLYEIDDDIEEQEALIPYAQAPDPHWTNAQPAEHAALPTAQHPAPLAGLSLDLTVRCGAVSLTLSALQHLAAGSVLDVTGVAPGEALLCHGERIVAYGELVDVDGRLGLQVTRMVFDR